jgi:predicted alpha/beta hydrolase
MDVIFPALDHAPLAGSLTEPSGSVRAAVLIGSATGVPRSYYDGYADYLAEAGFAALRFDYRGIGGSLRGRVQDCDATMRSWGDKDLAGAVRFLRLRHPDLPLLLVGHSVGGQLLGLLPEPNGVSAALFVGAQSAWWGNFRGWRKLQMLVYFGALFPALAWLLKRLPMKQLSGGEDLPPGVAREWGRWGMDRRYLLREKEGREGFPAYAGRIRSYSIADDEYAPHRAVEALLSFFPSASTELRVVTPASVGTSAIGHFGFFQRRFRETLWSESRAWLMDQTAALVAA